MPIQSEPSLRDSVPAPATSNRSAYLLVAFMWVAYLLNYCDRQVVFSIFPVLKSELNFSDLQLGLTGSVFLWVYGLCSPIAGQIGDHYSKRQMVVISLVLWSLVTILTGFSTGAIMLLVCRAAMGVSEALFMPSAISLTANAFPPAKRSRAIAFLMTAQLAGVVAGGWFGGYLADHGYWRYSFFLLGIIGVAYAVPYFTFLRKVNENAEVETKSSANVFAAASLARVPSYAFLCLVFAAFTFGLWLIYGWLPAFFYEKFSMNMGQAAFTATAYLQSSTFVGLLLGGAIADRIYVRTKAARFWLIATGMTLASPALFYLGNSESLLATKVAALVVGCSSGLVMSNIMASSFEVVPANTRASAIGFLNLFGAVISGFATLSGGLWKKSIGINNLLSATALIYLLASGLMVLVILIFFKRDYQRVH